MKSSLDWVDTMEIDYRIETSEIGPHCLSVEVRKYLRLGWLTRGGVSYCNGRWCQALVMVLDKSKENV